MGAVGKKKRGKELMGKELMGKVMGMAAGQKMLGN